MTDNELIALMGVAVALGASVAFGWSIAWRKAEAHVYAIVRGLIAAGEDEDTVAEVVAISSCCFVDVALAGVRDGTREDGPMPERQTT